MRADGSPFARGLWVVLPVRGESSGKSRLSAVLDRSQRMRLNRCLLRRTLAVVTRWQGAPLRCIVVSMCMRTRVTARRLGADIVQEAQPRRGLNSAIAYSVAQAWHQGAREVLILPCDLALLSPRALDELVTCSRDARVTIAPDRVGDGTNALLLRARARFGFAFGARSFQRHVRAAAALGWEIAVCAHPQLAFDLDMPEDVAQSRAFESSMRPSSCRC